MRFRAVFLLLACIAPAHAAEGDIPEHVQGQWVDRDEACDAMGAPTIVISATTLVYPDGTIDDVLFDPEESVVSIPGEGANYDYIADGDALVFHPEGLGKGSAFPMVRCPDAIEATEHRCGWLANLTPGDWSLVDADRTWIMSERSDDNAATIPVMDRVPAFDAGQFVSTGNYYGYGCACLNVVTNVASGRIIGIGSSKRLPLAACQADPALPALSDW